MLGKEALDRRLIPEIEMPFPRNRHHDQDRVRDLTRAWALGQSLLPPDLVARFLDGLRYTELISGYYVDAPLPVLKAINDFSLWFFVWDDRHDRDIVHRNHDSWCRLRDDLHAALQAPQRYLGHKNSLIGAFADCLIRLCEPMSERWKSRFAAHFHATIDAYDREFRNRTNGTVPTVEQYLALRRHTFGMWEWIDLLELAASFELPVTVYSSSPYQQAALASQEFSAWYNDLHSMPKEIVVGDFHNLGIVLAYEKRLPLLQAAQEVARRLKRRIADYQDAECQVQRYLNDLQASDALRAGVERCLFNMRNWISSVYWFHYESARYEVDRWADPTKAPYVADRDD